MKILRMAQASEKPHKRLVSGPKYKIFTPMYNTHHQRHVVDVNRRRAIAAIPALLRLSSMPVSLLLLIDKFRPSITNDST